MTMNESTVLPVHLFKDSVSPFVSLLNEYNVPYAMRQQRSGAVMAASQEVIELLRSAAMWGALATVIVAFLKYRHSRKVIITTKDKKSIHAEGLTHSELIEILQRAENLAAIETKKD